MCRTPETHECHASITIVKAWNVMSLVPAKYCKIDSLVFQESRGETLLMFCTSSNGGTSITVESRAIIYFMLKSGKKIRVWPPSWLTALMKYTVLEDIILVPTRFLMKKFHWFFLHGTFHVGVKKRIPNIILHIIPYL